MQRTRHTKLEQTTTICFSSRAPANNVNTCKTDAQSLNPTCILKPLDSIMKLLDGSHYISTSGENFPAKPNHYFSISNMHNFPLNWLPLKWPHKWLISLFLDKRRKLLI